MRRGFTLIELLFSMVIIAVAFSVLPKILQLSAKTSTQSLREEAIYNAIAYMGLIKSTAWDEENTKTDDILLTDSPSYSCGASTSYYRKGSFVGSRSCMDSKTASTALGSEGGDLDDIDDFGMIVAKNSTNTREYNLTVSVQYMDDIQLAQSQYPNTASSASTNTKYVTISVKPTKKAATLGSSLLNLSFYTHNIGQQRINRRSW